MSWIDIKDRLPPDPSSWHELKTYFTLDTKGASICYYKGKGKWKSVMEPHLFSEVTHWIDDQETIRKIRNR